MRYSLFFLPFKSFVDVVVILVVVVVVYASLPFLVHAVPELEI